MTTEDVIAQLDELKAAIQENPKVAAAVGPQLRRLVAGLRATTAFAGARPLGYCHSHCGSHCISHPKALLEQFADTM